MSQTSLHGRLLLEADGERDSFWMGQSGRQHKVQRSAVLPLPASCALLIEGVVPPVHITLHFRISAGSRTLPI
jgi:hypothetical protein